VAVVAAWADETSGPSQQRPAADAGLKDVPPEIAALLSGQSAWTSTVAGNAAIGYKDNLLLSHSRPEGSGFGRVGVEAMLWHLPVGPFDYFGFFNGDGTRYFSNRTINHDGEAFAGIEGRLRIGTKLLANLDVQGYYFDQIFDVSDTDQQRVVAELRLAGIKGGPTIRWTPVKWLWFEVAATAGRESLQQVDVASGSDARDHTRVTDPTARIGWRPSDRFEVSVTGLERRRSYATHPRFTARGRIDQGILAIHEREVEGKAVVTFGGGRHWKMSSRGGVLHYRDNGSGYLNYNERHAAQEIAWEAGAWAVKVEGEARRKDYLVRTVGSGTAQPPQVNDEFNVTASVERKLTSRWSIFAQYLWERVRSNEVVAGQHVSSYRVNEGLLGARWSWEK
jgi:hypothetical protein